MTSSDAVCVCVCACVCVCVWGGGCSVLNTIRVSPVTSCVWCQCGCIGNRPHGVSHSKLTALVQPTLPSARRLSVCSFICVHNIEAVICVATAIDPLRLARELRSPLKTSGCTSPQLQGCLQRLHNDVCTYSTGFEAASAAACHAGHSINSTHNVTRKASTLV